MDVRALVGRNVRRFRTAAGLSQEELAFRCRLDRTYVSGIERGVRNPTVLVLDRIARALGVSGADLLAADGPPEEGQARPTAAER